MADLDPLFDRLSRSKFRSRFSLSEKDRAYAASKGRAEVNAHAEDFIRARLAPAEPANDGKQTPMRGHPAFIAQHATATCCRGCLMKWHGIEKGRPLDEGEIAYVVAVLDRWIVGQMSSAQR
ncbi:DUF4186 domain-containing protein [Martelella lutilitoris]|uniref:DUF4186 domain-containing protein n=1 Tax=Martelella lutilitoris TaxID=2583532 RepID=A0A5C4JS38_9HYPH|nr:DUF4186 domain-containing protein [Martelella lutilitoris]TNB48178.1 DUF4186 domain-containing protein [Martelella lutilitoris]